MQSKKVDMSKFYSISVLAIMILLTSCKGKLVEHQSEVLQAEDVVELESDFIEFYNKFHEDSLYQLSHIAFPIKKNPKESSSEMWTEDNWVMHHSFSNSGGMFRRDFSTMNKMVIEKIIDANGFFEMERRFGKLIDGWNLIYYNIDNPGINQ